MPMSLVDALLLDPYKLHIWILPRTDGGTALKGSGTIADPYQVATSTDFDGLMNGFPDYTTVHLGPATSSNPFLTKGYADGVVGGWTMKKGMRILGSGVDVTTVKLEGGTTSGKLYFAFGHDPSSQVEFSEIADLAINCNLNALGANVAAGAVRLIGNHSLVRRVKAINWGTKTNAVNAFVFSVLSADPDASSNKEIPNTAIADCIAITPDPNWTSVAGAKVTALYAGSKLPVAVTETYGNGPYIRNCYVDCGDPSYTTEFRGLWLSSCRGGVLEGNQVHNTKFGVCAENVSARDTIVRNNWFRNVEKAVYLNLGGLNPSSPDTSNTLQRLGSTAPDNTIAKFTRAAGHGLAQGERVRIDIATGSSLYKGIFVVATVVGGTEFRYQMAGDPGSTSPTGPTMQKVYGVANLLLEDNEVELAIGTGDKWGVHVADGNPTLQTPDYVHGQVIIRRNRIQYLDGKFDSAYQGKGIKVEGAKDLIVQDNTVESAQTNPIEHARCGAATYFNNRTPSGTLIQGYSGGIKADELETEAEDALLVALY